MIMARLTPPRLAFLCWPGPIIFRLDAAARPHQAGTRQLMTSHSFARVICVHWTH